MGRGRWGKVDFRELKELERRIDKLEQVDLDRFCQDMAKQIAQMLLRKVKKRTIAGVVPDYATEEAKQEYWAGYTGGTLRDAWTVLPIEKQGNNYVVTIVNNMEYASYVEYGHRQRPGRYVQQLGLRLKDSWVPGRFMLTISIQEVENTLPALLEEKLSKFLYDSLYGGT